MSYDRRSLVTFRQPSMFEALLHKLYDASISVSTDGTMLVSSTRDRVLAWGLLFCIVGAGCLIVYLLRRGRFSGHVALASFVIALLLAIIIIPSVKHEYIHAAPGRITVDSGAWYRSSETVFLMHRSDRISERTSTIVPSNLIGDPDVYWHVQRNSGETEVLELNDFFNAHRMVLAYYYKDRGYRLQRLEEAVATGQRR